MAGNTSVGDPGSDTHWYNWFIDSVAATARKIVWLHLVGPLIDVGAP